MKKGASKEPAPFIRQNKYTKISYEVELRAVRDYLASNTCTTRMAAKVLGIERANICRYKRTLEKAGLLKVLFVALCKDSGHKAAYLTCNPVLMKGV